MKNIQQLIKKSNEVGRYDNVFPKTFIDAIKDRETGVSLEDILSSFNMYFLTYMGSSEDTRLQLPKSLRRMGVWITYVTWDNTIHIEWYSSNDISDETFRSSLYWKEGTNSLVGDLSISAEGNWVINGEDTGIPARGEKGITPVLRLGKNNRFQVSYNEGGSYSDITSEPIITQLRVHNNKLQKSLDLGKTWENESDYISSYFREKDNKIQISKDKETWEDISDNIAAWFRFKTEEGQSQNDSVGKIQISRDERNSWQDLSADFTNRLHIKGYVKTKEELPKAVQGDIYGVGPIFEEEDTEKINPIYTLYVYNDGDWVNNGRYTSIDAGVVQEFGSSETEIISQKAITDNMIVYNASKNGELHTFSSAVESVPKELRNYGTILQYKESDYVYKTYRHFYHDAKNDNVWKNIINWKLLNNDFTISPSFLQVTGLPKISFKNKKFIYDQASIYGGGDFYIYLDKGGEVDFSSQTSTRLGVLVNSETKEIIIKNYSASDIKFNHIARNNYLIGFILPYEKRVINIECEIIDEDKEYIPDVVIFNASKNGEIHTFESALEVIPKEKRTTGMILQYKESDYVYKTYRHFYHNPQDDNVFKNRLNWHELHNDLKAQPVFFQINGVPKVSFKNKKIIYERGAVYGCNSFYINIKEAGEALFPEQTGTRLVVYANSVTGKLSIVNLTLNTLEQNRISKFDYAIAYILPYEKRVINLECEIIDEKVEIVVKPTIYNIDLEKPKPSGESYTLLEAIKEVPEDIRTTNFLLTFMDKSLEETYLYQYSSIYKPEYTWEQTNYWSDVKKSSNPPHKGYIYFHEEKPIVDWVKKTITFKEETILTDGKIKYFIDGKVCDFGITKNARTYIYFDEKEEEFVCLGQDNIQNYKEHYIYIGCITTMADYPPKIYGIFDYYDFEEAEKDKVGSIDKFSNIVIPELKDFWTTTEVPAWRPYYAKSEPDYNLFCDRIKTAVDGFNKKFYSATMEEIGKEASSDAFPIYKVEIRRKEYKDIPPQKKIFLNSGLHGSEYANPLTVCTFIEMLLDPNQKDEVILALRDNFHWIIIPHSNPWGYTYRKRSNSNGVNLNRNFPYGWKPTGEPSDFGDYSGTGPLSENETQCVNKVLQDNLDFFIGIDGHCFTGWEHNPYIQFWVESENYTLSHQMGQLAYQITDYQNIYDIYKENNLISARIGNYTSSDRDAGGLLNPYMNKISKNNGYCTLLELPIGIYGKINETSGIKEVSNMNMISLVNIIRTIINCHTVKQDF